MNNQTDRKKIERDDTLRKPYSKPILAALGDLRSLTMGGSPGIGESGGTGRKVKLGVIKTPLPSLTPLGYSFPDDPDKHDII
jgi:hypothetical protein